ncbi:hypothetical protein HK405_000397, partial [Cladochytrium tenue]
AAQGALDPLRHAAQARARRLHAALVLSDTALVFRFFAKARFSAAAAERTLLAHLLWRVRPGGAANLGSGSSGSSGGGGGGGLDALSPGARRHALRGVLRFFGQDRGGRPAAVLDLSRYDPGGGGGGSSVAAAAEDLREYLVYALEVGRRCVYAVNNLGDGGGDSGGDDDAAGGRFAWAVPDAGPGLPRPFAANLALVIDLSTLSVANL